VLIRSIAKRLCRSASTIARELQRASGAGVYDANLAHAQCQARRVLPRRLPKLHAEGALFQVVRHQLKLLWSPQQIARKLRVLWPDSPEKTVSHETIYNAIYLYPRGELKRELVACLRHNNQARKPRSRGTDRRNQIPDMQSIHIRPPEVEDRLIPGHWEGELIKGAGNRSSVGTLVERTTGFVVLAKMDNATTKTVVDSFSAVFNREPAAMRKTMTYDQGARCTATKFSPSAPASRSISPIRTALGNEVQMRTPTACCDSTCPKDPTCRSTLRTSSTPLPCRSIRVQERGSIMNRHSSFILSTSHCYNIRPTLLINPVLRLVFDTAHLSTDLT
jgi:hypothetical protein